MKFEGRGAERWIRNGGILFGSGVILLAVTLLAAIVALYLMAATPRGALSWYALAVGAGLIGAAPVVANELLGRAVDARRLARERRLHVTVSSTTRP
ncbi:hypothetical protein [Haloprofundus marisrubri]|nr:hypothetical protein [Haloprofundus marisrubri]